MSIETKFILFQVLIILPFIIGTLLKDKIRDREKTAQSLIKKNLTFLEPWIVIWSIWGLTLNREMIILPVSGLILVILGFLAGIILLPIIKPQGLSKPTYLISSSLANHGFTMGGFICYIFMGERGLGLASIFITYFMFYTYLVIFTYSARVSGSQTEPFFTLRNMRALFLNTRNMPLYAAFIGVAVNIGGIQRPDINFPFDYLLMVSVALYYFTLGINFFFKSVFPVRREHITLAVSKFVLIPFIAFLLLSVTGISGDIKTIIIIQSFMPAAIYSVVASVLFNLDTRLASSLFFVNTIIFIVIVLPLLFAFYGGIL